MSGVHLEALSSTEMLHVLHFMMEEDFLTEYAEAQSDMRVLMYRQFYGVEYPHAYRYKKSSQSGARYASQGDNPYGDMTPLDPVMESKGYVPPTPMSDNDADPFGGLLDAPLR